MTTKDVTLTILRLAVLVSSGAACGHSRFQDVTVAPPTPATSTGSAREILSSYARSWRGVKEMQLERPIVVAFWISGPQGGEYHVTLSSSEAPALLDGVPADHDLGFQLSIMTLRSLDRNEMSAFTMMGQARGTDPIPLRPVFGKRLKADPEGAVTFRRLSFHFWTREWPEVVRFGEGTTRLVHGGNAAVFFYDKQFRSAWYQVKPGMHINADPRDQKNDHPQGIIVIKGAVRARLDGHERTISTGEAVFIPPGMAHEFWAGPGDYGEFVWFAFGEGA